MTHRALTREQSREVDRIAIEQYGMSGLVLMENAGRGVVDVLLMLDPELIGSNREVLILCGKGNNAGDGFVIARHLDIRGVRVRVGLLAYPGDLAGDALANYQILQHSDVPVESFPLGEPASAGGSAWILDAMLGTGAQGDPREPYATAIQWMNAQPARRLAVDVPSGLDCDTGRPADTHGTRRSHLHIRNPEGRFLAVARRRVSG